jgi:lysozyme
MTYSNKGLVLTEQFEGCRLVAYLDSNGIPTIGYGHTAGVYLGMTCTLEQAGLWLAEDIQWASRRVNLLVKIQLTQPEFDACVDFVFNCGTGNFEHSTLLILINKNDLLDAVNEFEKWDKAGGIVVAGLLRRRLAEKEEFGEK